MTKIDATIKINIDQIFFSDDFSDGESAVIKIENTEIGQLIMSQLWKRNISSARPFMQLFHRCYRTCLTFLSFSVFLSYFWPLQIFPFIIIIPFMIIIFNGVNDDHKLIRYLWFLKIGQCINQSVDEQDDCNILVTFCPHIFLIFTSQRGSIKQWRF